MVFPQPGQAVDAAVAAMFESARKNTKARRHHLVPRSYLVRWAPGNRLRVTETDTHHSYVANPESAAREKDFYSMASEDLDSHAVPPALIETILSRIEGAAKDLVDVLIQDGPDALDEWDAISFATFLGFQLTRGRSFRSRLMALANAGQLLMWANISDEGIAARLADQGNDSDPVAVAEIRSFIEEWRAGQYHVGPQPAALVGYAAMAAKSVGMNLLARPWWVYRSSMPIITCDEPVVPVPLPRHDPRSEPGVATAGAIIFPLDPHHVLVMFHPYMTLSAAALHPELLPTETDELNLAIAAHSDRWLFELPDRTRTHALLVPPLPPERTVMQKVGVSPNGRGELVWGRTPNRWWSWPRPPSPPVKRWWHDAQGLGMHELAYDIDTMPYALCNAIG